MYIRSILGNYVLRTKVERKRRKKPLPHEKKKEKKDQCARPNQILHALPPKK